MKKNPIAKKPVKQKTPSLSKLQKINDKRIHDACEMDPALCDDAFWDNLCKTL